ncbi:hypothetical protein BDZ97DRAFT_1702163, partial [Flammula alnicola]
MMKRSQSMPQNHAAILAARAQHANQQQQQQSFGLPSGIPQMPGGGPVLGGTSQQQPFHDSSPNHPQSAHLPPGFPNITPQPSMAGPSQPAAQGGNMMGNFGNVPNMTGLPPLDKARFEITFKGFCQKRGVKLDPRLLSIDSRTVDLHRLHCEVIKEGGANNIEQKDMWSVIGGRLGFVQFPGSDSEPAKSGPGVAQQLHHIYKLYLQLFDTWYTTQAIEKRMQHVNMQNQMMAARWGPVQMQQIVQLSHLSIAELNARGVDEKMIQFVESNRANLQRSFHEQKSFQNRVRST